MASFTFAANFRVNTRDLNLADIADFEFFTGSPVELRFFDDAQNFAALFGTGFSVSVLNGRLVDVLAGTVTDMAYVLGGAPVLSVTGWNLDGADLFDLIVARDDEAIRDLLWQDDDSVILSNRKDRVDTGDGDDFIFGLRGDDLLNGAAGDDTLSGGRGDDTLAGGQGADSFQFDERLDVTGVDTIRDFDAEQDTIFLAAGIFRGAGAADSFMDATRFALGTAQDRNDRIVYDSATGALSYDRDGRGAAVAVQFAQLVPGTELTAADIFLIG